VSSPLPSGDLGPHLSAITLSGAPALSFPLARPDGGIEPYPLPLTRPTDLGPDDWLRHELAAMRFKGAALRRKVVEQLVGMLTVGPSRADGLPYFRSDIPGWDRERSTRGRAEKIRRHLGVAVALDLGNNPPSLPNGDLKVASALRPARRFWAQLGVWPWTHAPRGKLPETWRTDDAFLVALLAWCERSRREIERELASCSRACAQRGSRDLAELPPERWRHADEPDKLLAQFIQRLEQRGQAGGRTRRRDGRRVSR